MPGRTNTEKIEGLYRLVDPLSERVDTIKENVSEMMDLVTKVAVLEQQIADLKKQHESLINRLWVIGTPILIAIVGALLTAFLRK